MGQCHEIFDLCFLLHLFLGPWLFVFDFFLQICWNFTRPESKTSALGKPTFSNIEIIVFECVWSPMIKFLLDCPFKGQRSFSKFYIWTRPPTLNTPRNCGSEFLLFSNICGEVLELFLDDDSAAAASFRIFRLSRRIRKNNSKNHPGSLSRA